MKKYFIWHLIFTGSLLGLLHTQESHPPASGNSNSDSYSYELWIDGGGYPRFNSYSGSFVPTYNLRAGLGRRIGKHYLYGFLEITDYSFESNDAISTLVSSNKRQDVAAYGEWSLWQIVYLGFGVHYTRQDNIVIQYLHGVNDNTTMNTGAKSYFGFYYLLGAGYQIHIIQNIYLPIGLYYRVVRDYDYAYQYNYDKNSVALQLGVKYAFD